MVFEKKGRVLREIVPAVLPLEELNLINGLFYLKKSVWSQGV